MIDIDIHVFFFIFLTMKTEEIEEPIDDEAEPIEAKPEEEEDIKVEEDADEKKPKTRKIEKTTWDWELLNNAKPIWTRKWAIFFILFIYYYLFRFVVCFPNRLIHTIPRCISI